MYALRQGRSWGILKSIISCISYIPFVSLTDRFIGVRGKAAVLLVNTVIREVNKTV